MKGKITNRLVGSLRSEEKPFEVFDVDIKGFLLRVEPTGIMTYYLAYKNAAGKRRRYRLGRHGTLTVAQARKDAEIKAGLAASGKDIQNERVVARRETEKAKTQTLTGFLTYKYRPWVLAHRKQGELTIRRIENNFDFLMQHSLHNITPWLIEKWRSAEIKRGKSKNTINRDLADLKSLLSKAVDWGIIEHHPLAKVKPLRIDKNKSIRYLSVEEEAKLRRALAARDSSIKAGRTNANQWRAERGYKLLPTKSDKRFADHLTPMVLLAINTGIRRGEMFDLDWKNVDLKGQVLTVIGTGTKNDQTRHLPLNSEITQALKDWQKQTRSKGLVFPNKEGERFDNISSSWAHLIDDAQIPKFRWHDLRHHFASKLVMAGVPLNTVRELMGHSDIKTTLRYAHLAPDHKAAAVEKLSGGIV